jgi:pantoate--beta-alanine ligase
VAEAITVVRTVAELRKVTAGWRRASNSIALVPTMGALHGGHLSLVELARANADRIVVSIFVNPTQFAPNEDLARYPRDEAGDLKKLSAAGADLVWSPGVTEMYPECFSTGVKAGSAAKDLEGAFRPQHFDGVATVCCKLFNQVAPDVAVFGEKDFQQFAVLRQLVRDLDMPLKLIAAPIKREADGLALSTRNTYLSEAERAIAPTLFKAISDVAKKVAAGTPIETATSEAKAELKAAGFQKVDYIEVRDAKTLEPAGEDQGRLRVLAAAWLGQTRLIDNVAV